MSKLQNIENALSAINGAVFQELCDSFLLLRNNNYSAFSRTGSQKGNQKTIKGTPDSFLLLPNGKYIFVEYSTNKTQGINKLQDDIDKCLDNKKTGIDIAIISEIIICVNFHLKVFEIETLRSLLENTSIRLTIYTLDSLALELSLQHRDLAKRYLQIPIDTGQIISIDKFIKEYNSISNGIATPLNNKFLHRVDELKELKKALRNNDFIILTGAPGVGKTKLAIEAIREFVKENPSFSAYCISYKHHSLLEDLYQYFDSDKNYILFVDDANRIDAFNQITGFYKSHKNGNFKIITTVRDYAFQEIEKLSQEYNPIRIDLNKFSDEQIEKILEAEPLSISNTDYQKEIVRIAEGNPRIAIMTALLAKEKQDITVLSDVSDLFEKYFSTFIKDDGQFSNDLNLKCLGIISFFYTIPFKDKDTTLKILETFNVTYDDFIQVIDNLDRLELVEIQYENVKIPEQNLSTYFFYRSFIKDDLLSFKTLLQKYFFENIFRFSDTVIPANNTFGPERVMKKLKPHLLEYWRELISLNKENLNIKFLNTFWFYLQDETLEYVLNSVKHISQPEIEKFKVTYSNNEFSHKGDEIIELLGNYFYNTSNLKEAIELSLLYVRKKPKLLSNLIYKIVSTLTFDKNDYQIAYFRQVSLFKILINGLKIERNYYIQILLELSKTFLQYKFHHFKRGRNNSFYHYDYYLENSPEIKLFRKNLWETINNNFEENPQLSFDVLKSLKDSPRDIVKKILEFDLKFLINIIEKHLNTESFEHANYVQDKIKWLKICKIKHPKLQYLKSKFTNELYEISLKIDWDKFRDKEMYEYDNLTEYDVLKELEIRKSFVFEDSHEVDEFYKKFVYIRTFSSNDWNYSKVLDIIIDENFNHNFEIGLFFLELVIKENKIQNFIPNVAFTNQLTKNHIADKIWSIISENQFDLKPIWQLSFLDRLSDNLVSKKYLNFFIETIKNTKRTYISHFEKIARFKKIEPNLFKIILSTILEQNINGADIKIWMSFFEEYFEELGDDLNLIKQSYIQQDLLQSNFDYKGNGFLKILEIDSNFLIEYVQAIKSQYQFSIPRENRKFGFIWSVNDIENVMSKVFDFFVEKEPYFGMSNHYCNTFFNAIPLGYENKAEEFLIKYARINCDDYKKVNIVVDIVRGEMKRIFNDILIQHISLNQDVNVFSNIWWRGNGGTYSGNVIIGDIQASDWRNILSIIEKSELGIETIPIKNQVKRNIENALKNGDLERKRRFLRRGI
ncbi:ATP-binding protein [Aureibaculum algae]|uniref:ATP-binding protein n=1 Tax=Aureibaculum algae TaxID=2584122 RepID=A0A5B7TRQ1_9FLAO|nr:ATP-binding protein [Aureibaculum algae]QCX38990.1 ATP-binding protein [Aureibaculum algae]